MHGNTRHEMPAQVKWLEDNQVLRRWLPGPAVVGLPTSERLNLVTINVDGVVTKPNEQIAMHARETHIKPILNNTGTVQKQTSINSIEDLKQEYPEQFDKLGNFPGQKQNCISRMMLNHS